jgi:hypothetical protein
LLADKDDGWDWAVAGAMTPRLQLTVTMSNRAIRLPIMVDRERRSRSLLLSLLLVAASAMSAFSFCEAHGFYKQNHIGVAGL